MLKKIKNRNFKKKKFNIYKSSRGLKSVVIFHVFSTFNNTIITLTDYSGNTISWSSSSNAGYKNAKKSTFYAAQAAAEKVGKKAFKLGYKNARIYIKGIGVGRDFSIRGIYNSGINILSVSDVTSVPHNGCKTRKIRRV
ncbi:MAG: 30S ribosomal protein S11 [Candidatus Nasuia deltocephalinicola]